MTEHPDPNFVLAFATQLRKDATSPSERRALDMAIAMAKVAIDQKGVMDSLISQISSLGGVVR